MVDRESAFLWETEALRSATHRPRPSPHRVQASRADPDWVTFREANEITGIPVPTLRKWARHDSVPSYLEETDMGALRRVSLRGVYRRAEEVGREPGSGTAPEGESEIATETRAGPAIPEGTMLVPLDAWNKMLNQLGNLHEAGQQLAEARERAAKAETEAAFLRDRLAELRSGISQIPRTESAPQSSPIADDEATIPSSEEETPPREQRSFSEYSVEMIKHLFSTWKGRPRR